MAASALQYTQFIGSSKQRVEEKLEHMALNVLEPECGYFDYSGLELVPSDKGGTLLSNYLLCKQYRYDCEAKLVGQPAIKSSAWFIIDPTAMLSMYGFVKEVGGSVQISNRIFETRLYNLSLSDEELAGSRFHDAGDLGRNRFVRGGRLNMRAVLEGFRHTYDEVFGTLIDRFHEKDGRELFLLYLKPIINGTGNYYIEAQTRDQTRTDVIVDYLGERFVVELKVWRGPRYNEEGEEQLRDYLEHFGLEVGYMLSFNFNKRKEPGLRRVVVGERVLWEETV